MKKFTILFLFIILVLGVVGCARKNNDITDTDKSVATNGKEAAVTKGDIDSDMCKAIDADFVYSATGKPVAKVEPDWADPASACRYYFTYEENYYKDDNGKGIGPGGHHIFMMIENLNAAKQDEANKFLGLSVKTDPRIKMENKVNYRENGSLYDIRLIINPNRYVRMNINKGLTDDELILYAAKVAEKIQGNPTFDVKKNPIEQPAGQNTEKSASQQAIAVNFLDNLAGQKIEDALKMMDANDETKNMWKANFNTIISLKTEKIEEAFKEEWTSTRQVFKIELNIKVKPEGEQLGWQNGINYRWITLEKNTGGQWMVHEIANNP
jgi:hypothetical protein